jgi:hypothetical protein
MTDECISTLRRRMIEDMTVRNFVPKTQSDYIRRVKNFAVFLGRTPDRASREDIRGYLLHLASSGVGAGTVNGTGSALRFFFDVTLDRAEQWCHRCCNVRSPPSLQRERWLRSPRHRWRSIAEKRTMPTQTKPSIVFYHGIWADGSCFNKVCSTSTAPPKDNQGAWQQSRSSGSYDRLRSIPNLIPRRQFYRHFDCLASSVR